MPTNPRAAVQAVATELLKTLAGEAGLTSLRVTEAGGGLACLILVWDARQMMPTANGGARRDGSRRAGCRGDILELVRTAGRPVTRKEVVRALRDAGRSHGVGTVAKALAELTKSGELLNPKDKRGYRLPSWPRPAETPSLFPDERDARNLSG